MLNRKRKLNQKKFKLDKDARVRIENEYSDVSDDFTNYEVYDEEEYEVKPKRHKKLRKFIFRLVLLCIIVLLINLGILLATGQLWFNEPKKRDYPVRGPVINEDMGTINWNKFAGQNIQMSYIRATKSTAYEDENFQTNWDNAKENGLPSGALHIFDIGMDGKEQAEHFIDVVGDMSGRLIPAIEVKLSGFYKIIPADYDKIITRLTDFSNTIEAQYGVKPVIMCGSKIYKNVYKGNFEDNPLWYESLYSKPDEKIKWDFWGYSNRVKFAYYESGDYLQMVLFSSSEEDFKNYFVN